MQDVVKTPTSARTESFKLPAANRLPPTAYCQLLTANCQLLTANANCKLHPAYSDLKLLTGLVSALLIAW